MKDIQELKNSFKNRVIQYCSKVSLALGKIGQFSSHHHWIGIIAILMVGSLLVSFLAPRLPIPFTLHLGLFSTSNWGVPEAETYQVVDKLIERFEESHPYVKVEYISGIVKDDYSQWLSDQIVRGEQPDVFMVLDQDFNMLASLGALLGLDKLVSQEPAVSLNQYYEPALEEGIYHNQLYAMPYQCNLKLMFVNTTLLAQENIPLPSQNWTLEEFLNICEKMTQDTDQDGQNDLFGFVDYTWKDAVEAFGLELFDELGRSAQVNDDQVKTAIQFMQKLEEYDQNQNSTYLNQGFDSGRTVFAPMSLAEYKTYRPYPWKVRKYSTFEWTMLPMPAQKANGVSACLDTLMMGISATTHHAREAWDLLRMFVADETTQQMIAEYTGSISALNNLELSMGFSRDETTFSLEFLDWAITHSRSKNRFRKYEEAMTLLETDINQILTSSTDLDLDLLKLQHQLDLFLRE